jgi:hypothetical protein
LDWAEALVALDAKELDLPLVEDTLGFLLKYQDDFETVRTGHARQLLEQAQERSLQRVLEPPPIPCG